MDQRRAPQPGPGQISTGQLSTGQISTGQLSAGQISAGLASTPAQVSTRRTVEIDSLAEFDARLPHTEDLNGWYVQSVDLTDRSATLAGVEVAGAVFLGCDFEATIEASLRERGALIFPDLPSLPFNPYRTAAYTATELYESTRAAASSDEQTDPARPDSLPPYAESLDAAVYAWSRPGTTSPELDASLAASLHDHAMADALADLLESTDPRQRVGIMGGHALTRTDDAYWQAADLAARLTRSGRLVLTGGGPGAMEAANLGAYLSRWPDALDKARSILSGVISYQPVDEWLRTGFEVRELWPAEQAGMSVAVPTWFYGHEPSNVFATSIVKFFANALREDTLLHRCRGGIIYLPGRAGTTQEIFQAVTENYYATDTTRIAPMILVGVDYWTTTLPAWPLLRALGRHRPMGEVIACVDTVGEALDRLESWTP